MEKIEKIRNLEGARVLLVNAHDFIDMAVTKISETAHYPDNSDLWVSQERLSDLLTDLKTLIIQEQNKE